MGKLRFSVHPLFYLFGLYFAATGKVFSFVAFTLCAVIHEFGHAIVAEKLGYKLLNVTLMPYGAIIGGDTEGLTTKDEILVAAAGPAVNLAIGVAVLALWWIFPESYPYTELAATANFSLFFVNLLPAYPLDGGRVLAACLSLRLGRKKAFRIVRGTGIALSVALLGLFVWSCFGKANLTLLFFSSFCFAGAIGKKKENSYVSVFTAASPNVLKKSREVKTIAVSADYTVKKLLARTDGESLYRVYFYGADGSLVATLEPHELLSLLEKRGLYDRILSGEEIFRKRRNSSEIAGDKLDKSLRLR